MQALKITETGPACHCEELEEKVYPVRVLIYSP
jgi:hypothetical protein